MLPCNGLCLLQCPECELHLSQEQQAPPPCRLSATVPLLWYRGINTQDASPGASQRALPSSCNSSFLLLTGVSAESLPGAVWQRLSWERRDLSQLFLVMLDISLFYPGLYLIYLLIKRKTFCRTLEDFLKHSLNVCLHKNPFFKVLPGDSPLHNRAKSCTPGAAAVL